MTNRPKRSKQHDQIGANGVSGRVKEVRTPDLNAQSLSVSDAVTRLGVSVSTLKRMCKDGKIAWFRTRGSHGHIRVLSESLEELRKGGETTSVAASPGLVRGKRENVEALRAEIEERKLKRELCRLDAEDSEVERRRAAAVQAEELDRKRAADAVQVQRARDAAEIWAREREQEEAEEHRKWTDQWVAWALTTMPNDAPREVEAGVVQAVEEILSDLAPERSQSITHRLVLAAIDKTLNPWRRQKQTERILQLSPKQLPFSARDYFEPTIWEMKAMETARKAIRCLPRDASVEQLRQAAIRAGRQITAEFEAEEARARARDQAERERQRDESTKKFLISVGAGHVCEYLEKLRSAGQLWDEDLDRKNALEGLVRQTLEDQLTGKEVFEDVLRIAREVVDAELEGV